jgi:putative restriction endonuclease
MVDQGLIGITDNHEIIVHGNVNDRSGVQDIINPTGKLIAPSRDTNNPHPQSLQWHREFHAFAG